MDAFKRFWLVIVFYTKLEILTCLLVVSLFLQKVLVNIVLYLR